MSDKTILVIAAIAGLYLYSKRSTAASPAGAQVFPADPAGGTWTSGGSSTSGVLNGGANYRPGPNGEMPWINNGGSTGTGSTGSGSQGDDTDDMLPRQVRDVVRHGSRGSLISHRSSGGAPAGLWTLTPPTVGRAKGFVVPDEPNSALTRTLSASSIPLVPGTVYYRSPRYPFA